MPYIVYHCIITVSYCILLYNYTYYNINHVIDSYDVNALSVLTTQKQQNIAKLSCILEYVQCLLKVLLN